MAQNRGGEFFTQKVDFDSVCQSMKMLLFVAALFFSFALVSDSSAAPSIARTWNERALAAIRTDTPHPPAQARNLFSLSVCMYDAWAAYDTNGAVGYIYRGKHTAPDIAIARREAISYAAFRLLRERHVFSRTALSTLIADTNQLAALGYFASNTSLDTSTPAGVGNSVYAAVSVWFSNDGSRQTNGTPYPTANPAIAYPDYPAGQGGYVYTNLYPLATDRPGITDGQGHSVSNINHWQRLLVVNAVDQNGLPAGPLQTYLGAQWLGVRPFAMTRTNNTKPWIDPGPPPFFGGASHAEFISNIVEVIRYGSELTVEDGVTMDISPASQGNNSLGANDGHGRTLNPATGQPYAPNIVKRGDFARSLTEFWADGPSSETPPGHWNTMANDVSDHPSTVKRIGGTGPIVDDLEWDVKLYFALNAAVHEAGCAAWSVKRYYDGWRPLSAIRYVGALGQSSDPQLPSYNANGLPLVPNLIELVTADSIASGRHAGLTEDKVALLAWPGETPQRINANGVRFIHADTWTTYQRSNFVSPAFPGYISGHSTFSRSAAELLTAFTGSHFFPGGMGSYTITNLLNEKGPSAPVTLQWATYFDAADQVGLSRIWGGIHPPADDFPGRQVGSQCGQGVWALASKYFDGSITNVPVMLAIRSVNPQTCELRHNTVRGFSYKLQFKGTVGEPFTDVGPFMRATNTSHTALDSNGGSQGFYRVVQGQ
jgi:hypothetical protein